MLRSLLGILMAFLAPAMFFGLPNYFNVTLQISGFICLAMILISFQIMESVDS